MGFTRWAPPSGLHSDAHRMTMEVTEVRTAMSAAPGARTALARAPAPLLQVGPGSCVPLVQVCYPAHFSLPQRPPAADQTPVKGVRDMGTRRPWRAWCGAPAPMARTVMDGAVRW